MKYNKKLAMMTLVNYSI